MEGQRRQSAGVEASVEKGESDRDEVPEVILGSNTECPEGHGGKGFA